MEQTPKLVLVGGGGHCKSVIDVALSARREILGILDGSLNVGDTVIGVPVLGNDDMMPALIAKYGSSIEFIITVGQLESSAIRHKLADNILAAGGQLCMPLISSLAHVASSATVGRGTVIMHRVVVNADAKVGDNCIINTGAIVEHDCRVGSFCHISTGAIANGTCTIGNDCFIGSRTVLVNNVNIADDVMTSAGSLVNHDLEVAGIYCGAPARLARRK